jgi:predicted ATP-dependent endonuclease of OLD family
VARANVVLDEPDVYMHPDLQHRLLDQVESQYTQLVLATHSVEIISTVDPESLVVIERSHAHSRRLMTTKAAQVAIEQLGGVHILHVARLYRSERFLMIEGKELPLLAALQKTLVPRTRAPLAQMPIS